jgi:hypothetical protein
MTTKALVRGWYQVDVPVDLRDWIVNCVSDYFIQPYNNIRIRAKKNYNGRKKFQIVFEGSDTDSDTGRTYNFPICYLIDINTQKLRGNKMNYQVGGGHLYSDLHPVYSDNMRFGITSKFNKEKKHLLDFCNNIQLDEPYIGQSRKRFIDNRIKKRRMRRMKHARKIRKKAKLKARRSM